MRGCRLRKPDGLRIKDHPERVNKNQPQVSAGGLPAAPAYLDRTAKAKWKYVAKVAYWLTAADGEALAAYCVQWSRFVRAERTLRELFKPGSALGELPELQVSESGEVTIHSALGVSNGAAERMRKLGASLGLNPCDRTRINAEKAESDEKPIRVRTRA